MADLSYPFDLCDDKWWTAWISGWTPETAHWIIPPTSSLSSSWNFVSWSPWNTRNPGHGCKRLTAHVAEVRILVSSVTGSSSSTPSKSKRELPGLLDDEKLAMAYTLPCDTVYASLPLGRVPTAKLTEFESFHLRGSGCDDSATGTSAAKPPTKWADERDSASCDVRWWCRFLLKGPRICRARWTRWGPDVRAITSNSGEQVVTAETTLIRLTIEVRKLSLCFKLWIAVISRENLE